jgi:hypothetical protein
MPIRDYPTWDPTIMTGVKAKLVDIRTLLDPYKTNLTPDEKKKVFKQGEGREAFVHDVTTTAHAFPNALPEDCDIARLDNVNAIKAGMAEIITYASDIIESLNDTEMLAGVKALNICNDAYKYFKIDAKSNAPLGEKVKEMGKIYNKNGKRKPGSLIGVPAAAAIVLKSLKKGSRIVNMGVTVLICKMDPELAGSTRAFEDTKIEPGGSFLLPPKITHVIIANDDKEKAGSVSVKFQ